MKRLVLVLAFACLLMGATSATAGIVAVGDPVEEDSWRQAWETEACDYGAYWMQAYMWPADSWRTPLAVTSFSPTAWNWSQLTNDGTIWTASGNAIANNKKLTFTTHFAGDKGPLKFSIQLYKPDGTRTTNQDIWYDNGWHYTSTTGGQWQSGIIPEPFSMAFFGSAFIGVLAVRLRRRRKEARP